MYNGRRQNIQTESVQEQCSNRRILSTDTETHQRSQGWKKENTGNTGREEEKQKCNGTFGSTGCKLDRTHVTIA